MIPHDLEASGEVSARLSYFQPRWAFILQLEGFAGSALVSQRAFSLSGGIFLLVTATDRRPRDASGVELLPKPL